MLQIGVEPLLGIELRAIAGQVKQLDLVLPMSHPRFDQLAVMHPQVIQDQEDLFGCILDQRLQEFNKALSKNNLNNTG